MMPRLANRKDISPESKLGKVLLNALRKHNWTLAQLSAVTGISVPHLARLIRKSSSVTTDTLAKIASGLNVESGSMI